MRENPARPPARTDLCALSELNDPGARGFRFREDRALFAGFVVRLGDTIRGFEDSCPHAGWPLGQLDDTYFTRDRTRLLCPGHGAFFRPDDGMCIAGPCEGESLYPWPVRIENGRIVTA